MTPRQEEALRDYLQEAIVPLIEQVLVKKLGQAMTFAAQEVVSPKRKPLAMWTEAQHERAYRNSPELHKDVKSLAAFKRVAKEIAAMYGIKGDA